MRTTIEIGTQKAYRYWRYVFRNGGQLQLLSWISQLNWLPHQSIEAPTPDQDHRGIHGWKTEQLMWQSFCNNLPHLVRWSKYAGADGVVFGTVEMWGIVWDHEKGYRAQFARPLSFDSCHGRLSDLALAELRANFFRKSR